MSNTTTEDRERDTEPPYCLDCGHPPAYHHEHVGCAATMIADDGEEYPCGCESERHFLGRATLEAEGDGDG